MAELKPVYLIHGDDHGAVGERRAGLRALAERSDAGTAGVEVLDGERATPAGVAEALAAMTLALGRRVIIVEGVERWRAGDFEQQLAPGTRRCRRTPRSRCSRARKGASRCPLPCTTRSRARAGRSWRR